jgi:hypothetical protein
MKIILGSIVGETDNGVISRMVLPEKLDSSVMVRNMSSIIQEIRKTNFVKLAGVRIRNEEFKSRI